MPLADISEMRFDQFINEEYRNTDIYVKRHSNINYRYNDQMEDIERTQFGRRLFIARTDAKYSQEDAAKAVGMKSQSTLSEAEISGKRSGFTTQLAALYKVNSIWLATGKGSKEINQGSAPSNVAVLPASVFAEAVSLLTEMDEEDAEAWITELKCTAEIQRAKTRAAANKVRRKQQEESVSREDKPPGGHSHQERRRTSN